MECKIRNVSINYETIGEGKPIIMLHGYAVDHRIMSGCMKPIFNERNEFKRVYIDLPGMGKSASAEWITSSDDILDIVIDFINIILPNEKFLLAGESYGGYLARGILYKMAERVEGILLICPVIIAEKKKRNLPQHVVLINNYSLLAKLSPREVERYHSDLVVHEEKIYERYKNEVRAGVNVTNSKFLKGIKKNSYELSFDVDNLDKVFQKPALILLGKQDACVGYKDAWHILKNYSRATFAVLDRAGHNLQIEQEGLFNAMVNEWLFRVKEFSDGICAKGTFPLPPNST